MSRKFRTLVRAPALTQTGYGVHSRQIIAALLRHPETYDVYLESVPWGMCAFLTDDSPEVNQLRNLNDRYLQAKNTGQDKDWDIFISVTIPQEFERRGRLSVGVTAGTETDRVSPAWIQKSNDSIDFIVVPSAHAAKSLRETQWTVTDQTGQQRNLKLEKPVYICPEGFDPSIFKKFESTELLEPKIAEMQFARGFNFLALGQWGNGGFGEDRKNIANTVLYFYKAFQGRKDVGLVLKTNLARNNEMDYDAVVQRLDQIKKNFPNPETLPPIFLVHGSFTDREIASLYNHPQIKALVSFTHGEGFGLPLLEAAACKLPIVATNWSAHTEFLKIPNTSQPLFSAVEFDIKEIPQGAVWEPILIKGSQWAVPREEDAIHRLRKIVSDYSKPKHWAETLHPFIHNSYNLQDTQNIFLFTLEQMVQATEGLGNPEDALRELVDTPDSYNVFYSMPMSAGDVFLSTAVIDGVVKKIKSESPNPELDVRVYFATFPQMVPLLEENPNVYKVIPWKEHMLNVALLDDVFDLVLTPNHATQFTFSNWVRGGNGRLLLEEFANHCQAPIGDFFIKEDDSIFSNVVSDHDIDLRHTKFVTIHAGSGKDNWSARKYTEWPEVIHNIKLFYPDVTLVQIGSLDEPKFETHLDLRGKTTCHQLAALLRRATAHASIDTFSMHLAASFETPLVAIFGSSHPGSTGPWYRDRKTAKFILLEATQKMGCKKACYKYQCKVNPDLPCINEIDSVEVASAIGNILGAPTRTDPDRVYQRVFGKISGYTTSYNAITMQYPFLESIRSMLGFCEEVVVVDHSTDGTWELLEEIAKNEPKLVLMHREWDLENPTMDGDAKAFARALCQYEFCWQQDLDEVVHEKDYLKIQMLTKRFPTQVDILHLPVIEVWGDHLHATGRRHSWKWRMSRNKPEITHGVAKHARLTDEKTGRVYAKEGMSDSCEYIGLVNYEPLPHTGFYNQQIEMARLSMPAEFENIMNAAIEQMPCVWHYSWFDIENKIRQFKLNWDRQWNVLYQKTLPERFPGVDSLDEIRETALRLAAQGGEDSDGLKYRYRIRHAHPTVMADFINERLGGACAANVPGNDAPEINVDTQSPVE